jgi:hypothetical protein
MSNVFYFVERRAAFGRSECLTAFDGFIFHGAVSPFSPLDDNELGCELGTGLVLIKSSNYCPPFIKPHRNLLIHRDYLPLFESQGISLLRVVIDPFFDFPHIWGAYPPVEVSDSSLLIFAKQHSISSRSVEGLYLEVCTPIHRSGRSSSFKVTAPSTVFDNANTSFELEADILKHYGLSWSRNGVILRASLYDNISQSVDARFFNVVRFII